MALNLSFRILDDPQDQDRGDALWAEIGTFRAYHAAVTLREAATFVLSASSSPPEVRAHALQDLSQSLMQIARGQDRDLADIDVSFPEAWQTLVLKSGYPFALACRLGTLLGGAAATARGAMSAYGMLLGCALQIIDDRDPSGLRRDLGRGRKSIVVRLALSPADRPVREELEELLFQPAPRPVPRMEVLVDATGAREQAAVVASRLASEARDKLAGLQGSAADWLHGYPDDLLSERLQVPSPALPRTGLDERVATLICSVPQSSTEGPS
jgi:geranylgeranyl pyrophosphate synthase